MLCSNDVLERFFGCLRLKYKFCSIDNLEILYASRSMKMCVEIMDRHPDWVFKNRINMQRLSLDYSSPRDWNTEKLIIKDVDIPSVWKLGRAQAEAQLRSNSIKDFDIHEMKNKDYTMLKPNGKRIGLSEEQDLSQDLPEEELSDVCQQAEDGEEEESTSTIIIDMIPDRTHDPLIEFENFFIHKSTVVKNMFGAKALSRDRLRRVQGLSGKMSPKEENLDIETCLAIGDPILVKNQTVLELSKVLSIKKAAKKSKLLNLLFCTTTMS